MFSSSLSSSMIFTTNPCISQLILDYLTAKETIALSMTCHDIQSHLKLTVIDISLSAKENVKQQQPTNEQQGGTNINDDENSNATATSTVLPILLFFQKEVAADSSGATTAQHPKTIQLLMKLVIPIQNPIHAVHISFTLAKFPTCDGPLKEILLVKERRSAGVTTSTSNAANESTHVVGGEERVICTSVPLPQLYNKATITIQTASLEQHCHFRTNTYSVWGVLKEEEDIRSAADTSSSYNQMSLQPTTLSDVKMKILSYNNKNDNNMNHSSSRAAAPENADVLVTNQRSRTDTTILRRIHTKCINRPDLPSFHTSIQAIPIEPYSFLSCFGMVHSM